MHPVWFVFYLLALALLGACFGSFACCQTWRLRYREKNQSLGPRSLCLHCKKQLKWYDNIPVLSWLILKGRCRHCHKKIGLAEFLSELALLIIFPLLGLHFWPALQTTLPIILLPIGQLLFLLALVTVLWMLLLYDAKWQKLPSRLLVIANLLAIFYAGLTLWLSALSPEVTDVFASIKSSLFSLLISVAVLAGIYYLLYFLSNEQAVGSGDWLLCLPIALVLGHWWLALIELFLSNFF